MMSSFYRQSRHAALVGRSIPGAISCCHNDSTVSHPYDFATRKGTPNGSIYAPSFSVVERNPKETNHFAGHSRKKGALSPRNVNPGLINPWLKKLGGCPLLVGIQTTFGGNTPLILWMDEILHHFEIMGNHCLLLFLGESNHSRVS